MKFLTTRANILKMDGIVFLLLARFFIILSLQMQFTLISWEIYFLSKDVLYIGYISIAELIPAFSLAFYGGYIVDKYCRKQIFTISLSGSLVASLFLLFSIYFLENQYRLIYAMFLVIAFSGFLRVFLGPTQTALLGELSNKNDYSKATALFSASWQIAVVLGPPFIGFLYTINGLLFCQKFVCVCASCALFSSFFIKKSSKVILKKINNTFLDSIKTGWNFVWKTKEILASFTLDMFGVLLGGATAVLPVFVKEVYHVSVARLGMLRSATSLGTILILITLSFFPWKKKQGLILMLSVLCFGVSMIFFGITTNFWMAYLILVISGIFDGINVNIRSVILQIKTPDEIKGKVTAITTLFIMSSNEIGSLESSIAAKQIGLQNSVILGGIATIFVVGIVYVLFPKLKKMSY